MNKKGKEFIFPENVDKEYGIWKGYTLKDIGYMCLVGLIGITIIALPPYMLFLVLSKIVIVIIAMIIFMAILTVKPISSRKNIRVRDHFRQIRKFAHSQKIYFLAPKKRDDKLVDFKENKQ